MLLASSHLGLQFSFNDKGLGPVRPSWRGKCVDAGDFNASLCNNKLVGAKAFHAAAMAMAGRSNPGHFPSSRDLHGHGTHVSSTAAGSEIHDAGMGAFSRGTARGMAPKARIVMYSVCDSGVCPEADIIAAVDAAVKDGVDILSMSLGPKVQPPLPANLNYPSFIVIFNGRTNTRTLTRTVSKVSEEAETYNVTVVAPEHVKVTVTPTTLEFKKLNEKKSYTVEFRSLARGNVTSGWDFGHIVWENKEHMVRSPVAFQWMN
ncbi:hypothetical protein PR202_gb21314 [Eleusine coracana subsp. coracana]|uniref:Subtilisin-like protease fibronectin type-III domain-containing protein n=1 Tax=Eleusine coracana subsp. coracana TaxID=191504 RepID=A0AAV5FCX2_ELECO|nr:hypothetical protein PR202_gb21314 [Eleusine coracana subsp. coracana]